jgi:hypothetical protein
MTNASSVSPASAWDPAPVGAGRTAERAARACHRCAPAPWHRRRGRPGHDSADLAAEPPIPRRLLFLPLPFFLALALLSGGLEPWPRKVAFIGVAMSAASKSAKNTPAGSCRPCRPYPRTGTGPPPRWSPSPRTPSRPLPAPPLGRPGARPHRRDRRAGRPGPGPGPSLAASSRCMPSGVRSRACSASCQPFLRPRLSSSPRR